VSSFLSKSFYNFENRLLPNDDTVLRNHGEDQGMHKGWLGGMEEQQGAQVKEEAETESTWSLFQSLGPVRSKTDAQDTSRFWF